MWRLSFESSCKVVTKDSRISENQHIASQLLLSFVIILQSCYKGSGEQATTECAINVPLNLPKSVDTLTKRFSLSCVLAHDLNRPPGDAKTHGRQRQTLDIEIAHHVPHCISGMPNKMSRTGQSDVIKMDVRRI